MSLGNVVRPFFKDKQTNKKTRAVIEQDREDIDEHVGTYGGIYEDIFSLGHARFNMPVSHS